MQVQGFIMVQEGPQDAVYKPACLTMSRRQEYLVPDTVSRSFGTTVQAKKAP